jgi:hypothetical protein
MMGCPHGDSLAAQVVVAASVPRRRDVNVCTNAGRLLAGLASVAVLAGCASGASPTPLPATPTPIVTPSAAAATPTPTGTADPTPSPTPAAVSYGPVTVVTGTNDCPGINPHWTTDPDGTRHVRDLTVECIDTTNDPRVSGTHTATWSMDLWGDPYAGSAAGVQSGTVRLENAGGAWEGKLSGVYSSIGGDSIVVWYTGTGGYAGLAYFELLTGTGPWTIHGQIFPGDPPTP